MAIFPSVCKKCTFRRVGCHSVCKSYLNAKAEHDKQESVIRREKGIEYSATVAIHKLKRN